MDDRDYQLLLDLYESKNITKAAQKQFLSQPAVTKRLSRIEEELGCTLCVRSNKGILFTAFGEKLIPQCRAITAQRQTLVDTINQMQGLVGGSLNLFASINYGRFRLPQVVKEYCLHYPLVDINVVTGKSRNIIRQLDQREDCIVILRGDYEWSGIRLELSTEPMCLVYSHENAGKPLNSYSYIQHNTDATVVADIARWAAEKGIQLHNTTLYVDDINTCKEMAQCGVGWCILPQICLSRFYGEIHNITFRDGTPMLRSTHAFCHESYAQLQQVRLFLETLKRVG